MSPSLPGTGSGSFRERVEPVAQEEWDETALPIADAKELFVTLSKAIRAVQLYDENNPVYQRFVQSLSEALRDLWSDVDKLVVGVEEERFTVGGEEVYRAESRSDSLAFLFFKDGIREMTLLPGIEDEELTRFLGVIQRARKGRGESEDLLAILWEADLTRLKYQAVDLVDDGLEIPVAGDGGSTDQLQAALQAETADQQTSEEQDGEEGAPPKPADGAVNRDDFNPTLYALDPREMEALRKELGLEMERDLRGDVLSALLDRLEESANPERQSEILAILRTLLPNFLSRSEISAAARVLKELKDLESRTDLFDSQRQQEAEKIVDRLSSAETMDELVSALEDGSITSSPEELSGLLEHLRPAALAPLLRASELTVIRELQPVLRAAVHGIAERNTDALPALLRDEDEVVLAGAARLAGRLQATESGPALADLMSHSVPEVRLAAVERAVEIKASTAAGALQALLGDSDRQVRIAAARGLGSLRYSPAVARFKELVTGKDIKGADISEKIAFFESYGELAGEAALDLMDKLLNGKGFLGRKESAEIRACASRALGKIGTEKARQSLQAAAGEEDPVVRSAVNRALRGEDSST